MNEEHSSSSTRELYQNMTIRFVLLVPKFKRSNTTDMTDDITLQVANFDIMFDSPVASVCGKPKFCR